jgi:hypothetical protein
MRSILRGVRSETTRAMGVSLLSCAGNAIRVRARGKVKEKGKGRG